MSQTTGIEWTDATWSPIRARVKQDAARIAEAAGYTSLIQIAGKMAGRVGPHCEHVSPGCENCYSGTNNHRCLPSNGTGLPFDRRSRDLVDTFVDEKILMQPSKWRSPKRIFVENQSDLFGEWVTDEAIDRVFAVMVLCPQHTFQVLTKRAERMKAWSTSRNGCWLVPHINRLYAELVIPKPRSGNEISGWPLPNVWLGCSVENQETADARIPLLLQTPAAVRFVSYEPALDLVDVYQYLGGGRNPIGPAFGGKGLDWVIVGGESGPGARPFQVEWAQITVKQCKAAGVPCFVKQLGSQAIDRNDAGFDGDTPHSWPMDTAWAELDSGYQGAPVRILLYDRKGGDWNEWPRDLRVREFPMVTA